VVLMRQVWELFLPVAQVAAYLHARGVIHRDLKALNVFVALGPAGERQVKVGDFGVGRQLGPETNMVDTMLGTPLYLSPELCQGRPYNHKTDVWALGVLLYELCALAPPFRGRNLLELSRQICGGEFAPAPAQFSTLAHRSIESLLQVDPSTRPTAQDFLDWHSSALAKLARFRAGQTIYVLPRRPAESDTGAVPRERGHARSPRASGVEGDSLEDWAAAARSTGGETRSGMQEQRDIAQGVMSSHYVTSPPRMGGPSKVDSIAEHSRAGEGGDEGEGRSAQEGNRQHKAGPAERDERVSRGNEAHGERGHPESRMSSSGRGSEGGWDNGGRGWSSGSDRESVLRARRSAFEQSQARQQSDQQQIDGSSSPAVASRVIDGSVVGAAVHSSARARGQGAHLGTRQGFGAVDDAKERERSSTSRSGGAGRAGEALATPSATPSWMPSRGETAGRPGTRDSWESKHSQECFAWAGSQHSRVAAEGDIFRGLGENHARSVARPRGARPLSAASAASARDHLYATPNDFTKSGEGGVPAGSDGGTSQVQSFGGPGPATARPWTASARARREEAELAAARERREAQREAMQGGSLGQGLAPLAPQARPAASKAPPSDRLSALADGARVERDELTSPTRSASRGLNCPQRPQPSPSARAPWV
jgi:hypothetical protein